MTTGKNPIIEVKGPLNMETAPEWKAKFEQFAEKGQDFTMDLSGIESIDLSGYNALIHSWNQANRQGIACRMTGATHESLKRFIHLTKMSYLFE